MKTILSILLTITSLTIFAQSKKPVKTPDVFEPAYIITLKGDTLKGELKMSKLVRFENYDKIFFRDFKTKKIRQYLPHKITGYNYNNYFYTSAYHNNKPCFFKVLSTGEFNLYQIALEIEDGGNKVEVHDLSVQKTGNESEGKADEFIVLEAKGLKKQLKDLFRSNKELVKKIADQKEILFSDDVIKEYFDEFNKK